VTLAVLIIGTVFHLHIAMAIGAGVFALYAIFAPRIEASDEVPAKDRREAEPKGK